MANSSKKYFWLKLKDDFFRQKEIKKLRKIAGGDTYTIIYQEMLLLSIKNEGKLFYEGMEESFAEELALELDESVENVQMTLAYLLKHNLILKNSEEEYQLQKTIEMIGSESDSAERVRRMRTRKRLLGEKLIDETRYGGNGIKCLERDDYKCAICGSKENIVIHHKVPCSNSLDDLICLCRKCHSQAHEEIKSVTCNVDVTKSNTEIEIDIEKEKEIDTDIKNNVRESILKLKELLEVQFDNKLTPTQIDKLIMLSVQHEVNPLEIYNNSDYLRGFLEDKKPTWRMWTAGADKTFVTMKDGGYINRELKQPQKSEFKFNQERFDRINKLVEVADVSALTNKDRDYYNKCQEYLRG